MCICTCARAHLHNCKTKKGYVRAPFSYLGKGWMDYNEIWYVVRDHLARQLTLTSARLSPKRRLTGCSCNIFLIVTRGLVILANILSIWQIFIRTGSISETRQHFLFYRQLPNDIFLSPKQFKNRQIGVTSPNPANVASFMHCTPDRLCLFHVLASAEPTSLCSDPTARPEFGHDTWPMSLNFAPLEYATVIKAKKCNAGEK